MALYTFKEPFYGTMALSSVLRSAGQTAHGLLMEDIDHVASTMHLYLSAFCIISPKVSVIRNLKVRHLCH
jgi:hypothetical protein